MSEATLLSDLWTDRRVYQGCAHDRDRRTGIDRRREAQAVNADRRGQRVSRAMWRSGRLERLFVMGGDFLALLCSLLLAGSFTLSDQILNSPAVWWEDVAFVRLGVYAAVSSSLLVVFWLSGHYARRISFWDEFPSIFKIILAACCIEATLMFFGQWSFSRVWLVATWGIALLLLPLFRLQVKRTLISMGGWMHPTVIIGTGANAQDAARAMRSEPLLGFQVMAFLSPVDWADGEREGAESRFISIGESRLPVYRLTGACEEVLERLGRPHVVVALDKGDVWGMAEMLHKSRAACASLNIVPPMKGLPLIGTQIKHFFRHEVMLLQVQDNLARKMAQRIKRAFDIVVSALSLLVLSLPLLAITAALWFKGSRPFFAQWRIGQDGKRFRCYKFQTMVPNAAQVLEELLARDPEARAEWETNFKLRNDPRVTPLGAFLRRTSLDELPQLWNVFKGEMSLVGPRPIVQNELEFYRDDVSYYLKPKPGITGLWQISGRSDVSYEERVSLDVWYAKNWTLWYDIVILIKTVREVMALKGAY